MNDAIIPKTDNDPLALATPHPLTLHPAAVYLSSLGPGSRRTMRHALDTIARILTNSRCDALSLDWSKLRYQHTAAVRAVLMEKYSPGMANKMLCALRRTLKEAQRLGLMSADEYARTADVSSIRVNKLLMGRALNPSEIAALLDVCTQNSSPGGLRDAALISLLRAGLRRTEVSFLELEDFDPKTDALTVRGGKGNKDRITYLPPGAGEAVRNWLSIRGDAPGPLLYPVDKSGQISPRRISSQGIMFALKKRGQQAGIANFSSHDFRRTFISELLDAGADVITVQRLAGHADPATTSKYDMRGEEAKRNAVAKLPRLS